MDNPYETPKSDIDTGEIGNRSIWWKIYFFAITILSFTGMYSLLNSAGAGIVDYAELLLLVIATAGLFGFVFSKRILTASFWIPFLVFYIITGLVYEPLSSVDMRAGMSDIAFHISTAIGYLLSLPGYYALYKYGKKNEPPWIEPDD